MKTFPMFLKMQGRRVVIVGGGEQAAQKCRLILKTEAAITILAPALDPELSDLFNEARIDWNSAPISSSHFSDAALVFIATGCPAIDASLHALAKCAGATVNVVDQPHLCDAYTPSIVDRSPVVVAIGTEGTAPVLARQIKTRVEEILEPRLGELAALAGRLRARAYDRLSPRARRDLWRWVFAGPARKAHARGSEREAARIIKQAIDTANFGPEQSGSVTLIEADPDAKDLITLRAVQRLQEADVIFYDRALPQDILDLARRDAERVIITPALATAELSQANTSGVLLAAARQGKRVVRVQCGGTDDASKVATDIFAANGIPLEIVPSVASQTIKPKGCSQLHKELTYERPAVLSSS